VLNRHTGAVAIRSLRYQTDIKKNLLREMAGLNKEGRTLLLSQKRRPGKKSVIGTHLSLKPACREGTHLLQTGRSYLRTTRKKSSGFIVSSAAKKSEKKRLQPIYPAGMTMSGRKTLEIRLKMASAETPDTGRRRRAVLVATNTRSWEKKTTRLSKSIYERRNVQKKSKGLGLSRITV